MNISTFIAGGDTGKFKFDNPLMVEIDKFFKSNFVEAYLVGGFVRDYIMDRPTKDLDIVICGPYPNIAHELALELNARLVLLDGEKAVYRLIIPTVEADEESGGIVQLDLSITEDDILTDLSRRDFTVNSIASPLAKFISGVEVSDFIDPYGGIEDLRNLTLKCTALDIFQRDPLRLIRAVRLIAQLGFDLDNTTRDLISEEAQMISSASHERVRDEFLRIISQPNPSKYLRVLDQLGLLSIIIPELDFGRGVIQPKEHYWDVFNHCIETPSWIDAVISGGKEILGDSVLSKIPWSDYLNKYFYEEFSDGFSRATMLKVAGLLHDIAKPNTKTIDISTGRVRFIGHDKEGSELGKNISRRLRFSNKGIDYISTLIQHHLRPTQMSHGDTMPTDKAIYRYYRDLKEFSVDILYLNVADYLAAKGPQINDIEDWTRHCELIGHIFTHKLSESIGVSKLDRLVDGHMVIKELGIEQGPIVGHILESIHEAQAAGEVKDVKDAMALARVLVNWKI